MLTSDLPNSPQGVSKIIQKHSGAQKISPNMNLMSDLGLDSIAVCMIIYDIENAYSVQMPDDNRYTTVQDIIHATCIAITERNKRIKEFMLDNKGKQHG